MEGICKISGKNSPILKKETLIAIDTVLSGKLDIHLNRQPGFVCIINYTYES
jgi:hypothetical protein